MKKLFRVFLFVGLVMSYTLTKAQAYYSCDQWATYSSSGYTIYNNIWGSNYGSQCLSANSYNDWWVDANHTGTGIKSYPNAERQVDLYVDNIGAVTSTFSVTRPSGGAYSSCYDIWYDNYAYEIMLWMNYTGDIGPISYSYGCSGYPSTACPEATNVNVGGHTWNIYRGSNGSNEVFSFIRTNNTNSGTVDIAAISQWLRNNGWFGNAHLHSVQFGFEITATSGTSQFRVNNFNVTTSSGGGGSTCNPTSITPYLQVDGGSWQQASSVTINSGSNVKFGPQPTSGGSWSWSGCGTSGSSREQTVYPTSTCTSTATYTNSCGAQSTQTFNVTVSGGGSSGGGSGSGSGNITVRARGVQGSETIELRANGSTIGSWTLGTSYQDYSASGSGTIAVYLINDNGGRDAQIDYVIIDGTTYQSENQATNTGVWQNNSCGGSYSEWLHCNGYIQYGSSSGGSSGGSSSTITIQENSTGFCSVDGSVDNNHTGYTGSGFANTTNASGNGVTWSVNVSGGSCSLVWRYANGSSSRSSNIMIDGSTVSSLNFGGTGSWDTWSNSSTYTTNLSAGTHLIRLQATNSGGLPNIDNFSITGVGISAVSCSGLRSAENNSTAMAEDNQLRVYPNPVNDGVLNIALDIEGTSMLRILDFSGKTVLQRELKDENHIQIDVTNLSGIYLLQVLNNDNNIIQKFLVKH